MDELAWVTCWTLPLWNPPKVGTGGAAGGGGGGVGWLAACTCAAEMLKLASWFVVPTWTFWLEITLPFSLTVTL